jgi:hypothetical protein
MRQIRISRTKTIIRREADEVDLRTPAGKPLQF